MSIDELTALGLSIHLRPVPPTGPRAGAGHPL